MGRLGVGECVRKGVGLVNQSALPVTLTLCSTTDNQDLRFPGTLDIEPKVLNISISISFKLDFVFWSCLFSFEASRR